MARVRGVSAAAMARSSRFSVSGRMSTKTGTPPRSTNAFAVDTNVNEGMITSSPGTMLARRAAISNAPVQECVSSALTQPTCASSQAWQRREKMPSPAICARAMASRMYSNSRPVTWGRLKGIGVNAQAPRARPMPVLP